MAVELEPEPRRAAPKPVEVTVQFGDAKFGIEPRKVMEQVAAVAAGDTATIAQRADGSFWQWDVGVGPRRLRVG